MRTPEAVLSYPELFIPKAMKAGDKPKYAATLVFLEGTDLSDMKVAAMNALCEFFKIKPEEAAEMIAEGDLAWPFMDNARKIAKKGYPKGSTTVNVKTYDQPGIVTQYADPTTGKPMPIQSESDVKYGSIVMCTVGINAYDKKGNKGVSFWLDNMQVRGYSDILGGRAKAEDEFEADAEKVDLPEEETPDEGNSGNAESPRESQEAAPKKRTRKAKPKKAAAGTLDSLLS